MRRMGRLVGWSVGRFVVTAAVIAALSDHPTNRLTDLLGSPLAAQTASPAPDLEQSRKRIEEIRAERERLERQQSRLQGQLQDVTTELRNLERQRDITNRLVNEIERQINGLGTQLDQSSAELILAQDNLVERRAVLNRRLVDIYKRGPLYTWRVLLTAESFGDLLSRYKYLYLTSRQDRTILTDVSRLSTRIGRQRTQLREVLSQLDNRRSGTGKRDAALRVAGGRPRIAACENIRRSTQETTARINTLERDEARLNEILAALERRRGNRSAPVAGGASTLTTEDIGRLDWPVTGADRLPVRPRHPAGRRGHPLERDRNRHRGGNPGEGRGNRAGGAGPAPLDVWPHRDSRARERLLLGVQPARDSDRGRRAQASRRASRSERWAEPIRTTGRICTSRFGARIRSRWTRLIGFVAERPIVRQSSAAR